ncbi:MULTISPECIES: DUF5993 family protein [unclassified Chelatococcus]|uniref:DUF5993 family protein n=1 Tax=unclassified Chelatococcus TaxID=2638111 RepID=UPI0002FF4E7F|nr:MULTISPECIES: DUF5993 family protein [unclassified Chelatococcus]
MDATVAFSAFLVTMLVAWLYGRGAAIACFAASLALTAGLYFYHATDRLPLAF